MGRIKYRKAIGQTPKRGRPPAGPALSRADLVKLYVKERRSVRDVAAALGCTKDAVYRALVAGLDLSTFGTEEDIANVIQGTSEGLTPGRIHRLWPYISR